MRRLLSEATVTMFVLFFMIASCATDRRDFEKAKRIMIIKDISTWKKISTWKEFLKEHQKSPLADSAKMFHKELSDFESCEYASTPEPCEQFIEEHPNSELIPEVKEQLEKLRQQIAGEEAQVIQIRKLTSHRRFNEAHEQLVQCLRKGNREAHFELARTLLFELKWSRQIWGRKISPTSGDKAAFKRERPHRGIIRIGSLLYELRVPYSRQPEIGNVTLEIGAAWQQFDYIRLIIRELENYLDVRGANCPNARVAKKWLKVLRPIGGKHPYHPYPDGFPSVEVLTDRLGEVAKLAEAMDSRKLSVEEPGGN